ncbi:MAG: hypothetical protein RBR03_00595 [Desulfuromonas thiophila]|nr:hypothetical protein [Desulfuromonas thiophila]
MIVSGCRLCQRLDFNGDDPARQCACDQVAAVLWWPGLVAAETNDGGLLMRTDSPLAQITDLSAVLFQQLPQSFTIFRLVGAIQQGGAGQRSGDA